MGLVFTPKLLWSTAIRRLEAQAKKGSFAIKSYQKDWIF